MYTHTEYRYKGLNKGRIKISKEVTVYQLEGTEVFSELQSA